MFVVITQKNPWKLLIIKGLLSTIGLFLSISSHAIELKFDTSESGYLAQKTNLRVCHSQSMAPFDSVNSNAPSIARNYVNVIENTWLVKTEMVISKNQQESVQLLNQGQCDLIGAYAINSNTSTNLKLSQVYLTDKLVFVTNRNAELIKSMADLSGQSVVVLQQFTNIEQLSSQHADIQFLPANDVGYGIELVKLGQAKAIIAPLPVAGHHLQNNFHLDFKINGELPQVSQITMAGRASDEILLSLIDKTLNHLSDEEMASINNQWIQVNYQHQVDYNLLFSVITLGALLFIGLLYRHILLSRHTKQLTRLSQTDKLTSLYNRVKTDEALNYHINSFRRYSDVFSIILLDLDNFKLINDRFGHMVGDQTLIRVAKVLQQSCRNTDIVGRWGGEEFLIICPKADLQRTRQISEKLRRNIEEITLSEKSTTQNISASFGIAEILIEDTHNSLILRADKALMQAKQNGKNQLVLAGKNLPVELMAEC